MENGLALLKTLKIRYGESIDVYTLKSAARRALAMD